MKILDYSISAVPHLSATQAFNVAATFFLAMVSAIVGWNVQNDTALLVCYVLFILADTALAVMLLSWRRQLHVAVILVGWLWVAFGLLTLIIFLGEQSGLLRE
jgi:hypothetical protein